MLTELWVNIMSPMLGNVSPQITARKLHNISCQIKQIFIPSLPALFALRGNIIQILLPCIDLSPSGISKLYGKHPRPGLAVQFKFLFHRSLRGEVIWIFFTMSLSVALVMKYYLNSISKTLG